MKAIAVVPGMKRFPAATRGLITWRHPVTAYRDLLLGPLAGIENVIAIG